MSGNRLKIVLVGPGFMPIPTNGWGAIETVIWNTKCVLEDIGHEVFIVNTQDKNEIVNSINDIKPDFVHFHYEPIHSDILHLINYPKAITSHSNYSHTVSKNRSFAYAADKIISSDTKVFSLSKEIANIYVKKFNIKNENIFVVPNGIPTGSFTISANPSKANKTLFLGKVDQRKQQHILKNIPSIDIAGPIQDGYNFSASNYIGQMTMDQVQKEMTEYGNLVLISEDEGQPLVCVEALSAGLGLVVTKNASDNLDSKLPFITVIDNSSVHNKGHLLMKIEQNRKYSASHREDILEYAKNFELKNIIINNYIPAIRSIIQ